LVCEYLSRKQSGRNFAVGFASQAFAKNEEGHWHEEEQSPKCIDQIDRNPESSDNAKDQKQITHHQHSPRV
jgi:hypothetical protein